VPKNPLLLNTDEFVRVVQTTGKAILGRYDGVNYEFPDAQTECNEGGPGYRDVHKDVAQHIFGFGLPEDAGDDQTRIDKKSALLRLGWLNGGDSSAVPEAMLKLKKQVRFLDIPPFPVSVLRFEKPEESGARVPSPPMGPEGGEGDTPVAPAALTDPFKPPPEPPRLVEKETLTLPNKQAKAKS
jgi:hypothetical protein